MKQCKIVVTDEVNVKIIGLELTERKALVKMFEYEVPGARYLPAVRLGRWNGKVVSLVSVAQVTLTYYPKYYPI